MPWMDPMNLRDVVAGGSICMCLLPVLPPPLSSMVSTAADTATTTRCCSLLFSFSSVLLWATPYAHLYRSSRARVLIIHTDNWQLTTILASIYLNESRHYFNQVRNQHTFSKFSFNDHFIYYFILIYIILKTLHKLLLYSTLVVHN